MAKKPILELIGGVTRFGRLSVLGEAPPYIWAGKEYRLVLCICDCGTERHVQPHKLRSGQTLSCGCYSAERASTNNRTHGMTGTPEYISWQAMRHRCYREEDISYSNYGGRGITVCDEWRDSFENFYADMGPRPEGMTLDRIEVNRNYEPSNCRWATPKEQADNTRVARKLLVGDRRINMSEASRRSGLTRSTLRRRMRLGMKIEEAMTAPIDTSQGSRRKSNNRHVVYQGERMLLIEMAERTGIDRGHLWYHLKQGRSPEQAVEIIMANRNVEAGKCRKGHNMIGDNIYRDSRGRNQCRTCRKQAAARNRAKAKEKAA